MTDLQSLYAGICAEPDEDTPRLALADFLDEQGGAQNAFRADLIRTHCRLARAEPWSEPWRELNGRWLNLYRKVLERGEGQIPWLAHLKGRVKAWALERGLVGHLTLFSKRFVTEGDSYFEQDPIRSVKFVKLNSTIGTVKPAVLFACPHMARIVKLDLDGSGLKGVDFTRLAASPGAAKLRSLALGWYNPFGTPVVPKLLKAMPELTELSFQGNVTFGDAHARALAKCPELVRVVALDLSWTPVAAAGVAALVSGHSTAALTVLRLGSVPTGGDGRTAAREDRADGIAVAEAIAAAKGLSHLQELELSNRAIGADGVKVLVGAAKGLPALRRLHLEGCRLTLAAVKALAESALGARLLYLNLRENPNLLKHRTNLKKMFPGAYVEEAFDHAD